MIYNIPEWPAESDIDHTATTWVLARDAEFSNVEDEVDESTDFLLVWDIDKIIPTGEVWYIKALRKLEDEEGNDLHNTKWIGPKPIFSEESNVNDYLAPKFYIDTPYITDILYKENESLSISLTPYKTNVGYRETVITVEDSAGEVLLTKFVNMDETDGKIVIGDSELDLSELNDVRLSVVHTGTQSTISASVNEVINLKNGFYVIEGNTKELDPTYINKLNVKSTTFIGVTVTSASIITRDGVFITQPTIVNNEISIKNELDFKSEYILKLTVQYTDSDGSLVTTDKNVILTTRDTDEIYFDIDTVKYANSFKLVNSTEYGTGSYEFDLDKSFNAEEFFTYSIPVPDITTGNISLFGLDKAEFLLSKHIEDVVSEAGEFSIRLLTKTSGVLQLVNSDGIVTITPFIFDPYTDNIALGDVLDTGIKSSKASVCKVVQLPSGIFVIGIDKDDDTKLLVKEFDINTASLTDVYSNVMDGSCNDVAVSALGKDKILIIPNSASVYRTYIYSTIDNYLNTSVVIPGEFREQDLLVSRLYDGNVVVFKNTATETSFNHFIFNRFTETTSVMEVTTAPDDKFISNIIALKNGEVLTIAKNSENTTADKAEFWLFS